MTTCIVLHKTQRQTHALCLPCGEAYIANQLNENLINKKYTHIICCSGKFEGNKRNICKKELNVAEVKIPEEMQSIHVLIVKIAALAMPGATECLNGACKNIVIVPDGTHEAICTDCHVTWCQKCMVTPYHTRLTCAQNTVISDNSPEGIEMKRLIAEKEVKLCPTCNYGLQKESGCNKVKCSQCNNYMCYLCGIAIKDYTHFSKSCILFDH
jgi:E3 ubiquitin-protein ligase RNF14